MAITVPASAGSLRQPPPMTPIATPPAFRLRSADPADVQAIAILHDDVWRATHQRWLASGAEVDPGLAHRRGLWSGVVAAGALPVILAEDADGALLGFAHASACRDPDRDARRTGELTAIHVAPAQQRRGLGSALLERAVAQLGAAGFSAVSLWVAAHNVVARRFHHAHGFLDDGGRKHAPRSGFELVRYVRSVHRG
jgi:L-amino acid N-acyltransferase YncA